MVVNKIICEHKIKRDAMKKTFASLLMAFSLTLGHAQTADNPLVLQLNADSLTVLPDSYVSYTATESGLLVIHSNAYAWNTESDGWVNYFKSVQDTTVWELNIIVDTGRPISSTCRHSSHNSRLWPSWIIPQ